MGRIVESRLTRVTIRRLICDRIYVRRVKGAQHDYLSKISDSYEVENASELDRGCLYYYYVLGCCTFYFSLESDDSGYAYRQYTSITLR